jgi:2-polyprenyl-6-methoxyphenol hydroxylase-like FAD-dependent oxidoreductase
LMYKMGILDEFLKRPHSEVRQLAGQIGGKRVLIADFTHLPTKCKFIAMMPQWDFLDFIAGQAKHYPTFHLAMEAKFVDLIEENGVVVGARAQTPSGELEIRASLTVGADGRHSDVRERAGFRVIDIGAPIDVMWLRLSREPSDPAETFGRLDVGHMLVLIDRNDYWQIAYVLPKGASDAVKAQGLPRFREKLAGLAPFLAGRAQELKSWDNVKLLTVTVDRLEKWSRAGVLCIGDSAHAMSPVGGVGINLAIQDAVATANLLGAKLLRGNVTERDLEAVQKRRTFPVRATQRLQVLVQNNVIKPVLGSTGPLTVPWLVKLMQRWPALRRVPARVVGLGLRPEHVRTGEAMSRKGG